MTLQEALGRLEALGNEKMRQYNKKHGAGDNQYGVKMGDIRNVAKLIKIDHQHSLELWSTDNIDAMLLATLVIQVKALTLEQLDVMAGQVTFAQVSDWFYNYVVKEHPQKELLREKWMQSSHPWTARSGWSLMSGRVARNPEGIDLPALLGQLERQMPKAPPEVQWTMNSTLAQVGIHHPALRDRAIDIGERLGIYRDYPVAKGCTSPFAPIWIRKMVEAQ